MGSIPGGASSLHNSPSWKAALTSDGGPSGAVLRTPGVAVAPRGRDGSLSRGRPASGPRAEWAGTTAPRSRGALRPAAPGAGGYKWSGGSPSRLSPPRVAAVPAAFRLSSLKKKEKDKKKPENALKYKKKEREKEKAHPPRRSRGEVTFARFRPARARRLRRRTLASSVPVCRSGGEPPAPRGSPASAPLARRPPRAPRVRAALRRPGVGGGCALRPPGACRVGTDDYSVSLFPWLL